MSKPAELKGTGNKFKTVPASSPFDIPKTLDPNQFPTNSGGGPFFSGSVVPGVNSFIGPAYQGDPKGRFRKLNFNLLNNLDIQSGLLSRDASQKQWEQKYPLLAQADKAGITSNLLNISGKHDPFIYNALQQAGLGGMDLGSSSYDQSKAMGMGQGLQGLLSKEHRDRSYAQGIFNDHPITRLGLGPADLWNIEGANTGGLNTQQLNAAQNATTLADAKSAANSQVGASILSAFGQLAGSGIRAAGNANSPYLTPGYYQQAYVAGGPGTSDVSNPGYYTG